MTKTNEKYPCIQVDDTLDNVVLDNLDLYKYCDNGNDILCISLIIAALYSNTTPVVITSSCKTICDCISIAIYGVPCSIINFPTATSKMFKQADIQNAVAEEGLVLLRGVLGGINETNILDIIRGEDGRDFANRIVIVCEAAEELQYVPKWFFNYAIGIDLETCRLSKKTEGDFYTASDPTVTNKNANSEKNALELINPLKKVFPEIIPQLNARVSVIEIANGIEEQLPVCKAIIKYDLLPILRSIGMDDDEAISRIKSARFSNFSAEELLARLEADD